MKRNRFPIAILIVRQCLADPVNAGAPSFQGMGDLVGGAYSSGASDISADGRVVVGWSVSGNGTEAIRWTSLGGMERPW